MVACVCVTLGVLADVRLERGSVDAIRRKLHSATAVDLARGFFFLHAILGQQTHSSTLYPFLRDRARLPRATHGSKAIEVDDAALIA